MEDQHLEFSTAQGASAADETIEAAAAAWGEGVLKFVRGMSEYALRGYSIFRVRIDCQNEDFLSELKTCQLHRFMILSD